MVVADRLRFSLAVAGLLALTGVNSIAAMSLDSGNPPPVHRGVQDIVNNPGWLRANYQMYPWWLSEKFGGISATELGSSASENQIFLGTLGIDIPGVRLIDTGEPLNLTQQSFSAREKLLEHSVTIPGHKVLCRLGPDLRPQLCDFFIAWDSVSPPGLNPTFIAVKTSAEEFGLVEKSLLRQLQASEEKEAWN